MQVVGIAAGGHSKVVVEALRLVGGMELIGLLDPKQELWGTQFMGVKVLGSDEMLPDLMKQGVRHAFIGLGTVGDTSRRKALYEKVRASGFEVVTVIHPSAIISPSARIGYGATILSAAVINAAASLGENVIVNTGAIVEHDCIIGDHAHIATGARLASTVQVGRSSHVGVGAAVRQCIRIGCNSVVGAGAAVVRDVPDNVIVGGVPAQVLRKVTL